MNENFRQVFPGGFFLALMEAASFCGLVFFLTRPQKIQRTAGIAS